jgi:protein required for attachment to host cells
MKTADDIYDSFGRKKTDKLETKIKQQQQEEEEEEEKRSNTQKGDWEA